MRNSRLIAFALTFLLASAFQAVADNHMKEAPISDGEKIFKVDDPAGRNAVTFTSQAPLEDIVGISHKITGFIVFNPDNPEIGGRGELSVPVTSLNTGIPRRDEHLKGPSWLNAEEYPDITLNIRETRNVKKIKEIPGGVTYEAVLVGDFSLNGTTRTITIPGRFTYLKESETTGRRLPGDLLAARAAFDIALADYGIAGPEGANLIGFKVGDTIAVEVTFVGNSENAMPDSVAEE